MSAPEGLGFRRATLADAPAIAGLVREGFETYRAWAPPGWEPPAAAEQLARTTDRLRIRGAWARLAERDGTPVGVVGYLPHHLEDDLAYFWLLFVSPPEWGTGLARTLHQAALHAARSARYARMTLVTPAGQARARAFYAREGWRRHGPVIAEPSLGLDLVELRRAL